MNSHDNSRLFAALTEGMLVTVRRADGGRSTGRAVLAEEVNIPDAAGELAASLTCGGDSLTLPDGETMTRDDLANAIRHAGRSS